MIENVMDPTMERVADAVQCQVSSLYAVDVWQGKRGIVVYNTVGQRVTFRAYRIRAGISRYSMTTTTAMLARVIRESLPMTPPPIPQYTLTTAREDARLSFPSKYILWDNQRPASKRQVRR